MAMARLLKPLVVSILVCIFACADVSGCLNANPCLCEIDEYNKIDLTPVSQHLKPDEWLSDVDVHGNSFYFHGCKDGDFNATAHGIKVNATTAFPGSLIHANTSDANHTYVEVVGKSEEITFFPIDGEKDSYQLIYKRGENVTARVRLICLKYGDPFLTISSTNDPSPSLSLGSQHACIITNHPGLSTGSVLLIIFFVAFGIYFIGGCILLYLMRGARGVEMIPNIDFWKSLPGLMRDGIIFLFSGCNASSISTAETYDRI